jgi:hypothetical protein
VAAAAIGRVKKWNVSRPQGRNAKILCTLRHRNVVAHGRLRRIRMRFERQDETNRQCVSPKHTLVSGM